MLRYQEMVPDYYIEASRDFQVLCRLYDFAMNSLKFNIDSMQELTDTRNVKDTVLPLLGDKLGIYDKEAFSNRQLLEALPIALKYKGSLKSVNILLNAFLDSMDVFENAVALHSKDEESAAEISAILNRPIGIYSIVIILSTFPSLTNLHVLDTYLNMVIPTGLKVEYAFGVPKDYFERFKYKEYTFLFYTHRHDYVDEGITVPYISMIKNKSDKYSATFDYAGTDNITTRREFVGDTAGPAIHILKHKAVPIPPETNVEVYQININKDTDEQQKILIPYMSSGEYSLSIPNNCITYIQYSYNKTKEFIDKVISDVDVNAVSLATVMGKDQFTEDN